MLIQTLGIFSLSGLGLFASWPGHAGIIFFFSFIAAYYSFFPGALGHYEQRYLYVFIPFLLIGVVYFMANPKQNFTPLGIGINSYRTRESAFEFPSRWRYYQRTLNFTQHELKGAADWCLDNLSPSSILLVHDTGYIAYATSFRLVDFVGLKTPSSVHYNKTITWPSCRIKTTGCCVSDLRWKGERTIL